MFRLNKNDPNKKTKLVRRDATNNTNGIIIGKKNLQVPNVDKKKINLK